MRRHRAIAVFAVVLSLVAVGCGGGAGGGGGRESGGAVKEGGTLRIGTSSGISSLNPFVGFNQDDYSVWMYIYPSLLQYTHTFDLAPYFATDWARSKDGLTVTFHTASGATWSDGEPLTAEDAAWTINMILKYAQGPTGTWAGSVGFLKSATAPDANTVVATYTRPAATALSGLGFIPILPPEVWQQYATGDGKAIKTFANEPTNGKSLVCGGPFTLTEYRKHDVALFEKNPNFFGPMPHIDGFGLEFFDNEDAMITALKTNQIDAINEIPPTSVDTLRSAGMYVFEGPALALRDFIINSNPNKTEHRELLDPQVKEALEYAVDRNAIVQTAWLGHATPGAAFLPEGDVSEGIDWHNPNIQPLPFDIAKANEILDSLGYQLGPDGIRVADGHPMAYNVLFPHDENGAGDRAFQIIQNGFKQIGVKLTLKKADDNAVWFAIGAPDWKYLDFDFAMWDWFPAEDPDFLLSAMLCNQYGSWNDSGYCNPAYDKLYADQQGAVDLQERQKIVYEMQQMVYNDRPYIILTYDNRLDAWNSKTWGGFVESNQGFFNAFSTESLTSVHQL